jgi:hypothetical protein
MLHCGNAPPRTLGADQATDLLPSPRHPRIIKKKCDIFPIRIDCIRRSVSYPRTTATPPPAPVARARPATPDVAPGATPAPRARPAALAAAHALIPRACPATPALLPASPDDADRRRQHKEKRALTRKPFRLASCYGCGTPALQCRQRGGHTRI